MITAVLEDTAGFTKTVVLPTATPHVQIPEYDPFTPRKPDSTLPFAVRNRVFRWERWLHEEYRVALYREVR